jgi:hypothetical protein
VWDSETLIYCGMSGREFEKAVDSGRVKVSAYFRGSSSMRFSRPSRVLSSIGGLPSLQSQDPLNLTL